MLVPNLEIGALQGLAQQSALNYQGQVARNNAVIAARAGQSALMEGQAQESISRVQTGLKIGEQKAAQGANSVDVNSGTPADVRTATRSEGEMDALTIRYNAAMRSYGYKTEAANYKAQAAGYGAAADLAVPLGLLSGFQSFLGQAQSLAESGGVGG